MTSFISTLSLLILVFSNGCFTLPVFDEQLSNSTSSFINNDLTTGETFNLRLVDSAETRSIDEHMGFEVSTSMGGLSGEKSAQALRSFDGYSTSEPMTITTEQSYPNQRDNDYLSLTTVEVDRRSFNELENETENSTQEMPVELTTNTMFLFTSESSSVVPKVSTRKLSTSTSTSTKKYVGLLRDDSEQNGEYEQELSTKPIKTQRKIFRKSQASSTRRSELYSEEENSKESSIPTAVFDQQALDKVPNVPNNFLMLDESNDLVVTDLPRQTFQTTMAYKEVEEERPLNQGSTLLLFLLAALLFCACVLASTLAFVKNRHTLKRKSRITEMEAHLDEHHQHYPHPLMFQQHHEK